MTSNQPTEAELLAEFVNTLGCRITHNANGTHDDDDTTIYMTIRQCKALLSRLSTPPLGVGTTAAVDHSMRVHDEVGPRGTAPAGEGARNEAIEECTRAVEEVGVNWRLGGNAFNVCGFAAVAIRNLKSSGALRSGLGMDRPKSVHRQGNHGRRIPMDLPERCEGRRP